MKSMMIARPSTLGYSIPKTPLILKLLMSAYREKHRPKKNCWISCLFHSGREMQARENAGTRGLRDDVLFDNLIFWKDFG